MTSSEIRESVIALLTDDNRYRKQPRLLVRPDDQRPDIEFAFDAVLIGPKSCDGLVTVQVINRESVEAVRNEVRALTTWLSGTDSRRSLVLIAIVDDSSASPSDATKTETQIRELIDELSSLCRVLRINSNVPTLSARELKRLVRPLLPLPVTPSAKSNDSKSPIERLKTLIADDKKLKSNKLIDQLIRAAAKESEDSVQKIENAMAEWIEQQLAAALSDEVST